MWMVYDQMEGIICVTDDKQEALRDYEKQKESYKKYVQWDGEFQGDERVILALIKKDFFSDVTKNPEIIYDEDDNEVLTGDTYWDWKETTY
ncbi:hypothetical protein EEL30_19795 [Brevibacillus laterosporus]|uniref:Uncharacterized protein n=1 Tax=Brevibacillus laterosporus TaxID=1465 RepID=A0A518VBG2_BRELA|nr:hypothetical protein EEL30_19795 [Brevibacillus laterosporus]